MRHVYLGTTGLQVSELCLGTMTFGKEADPQASAAIYRRCREAGINFFDCANVYTHGESERILGGLIAGERDRLILTSKVGSSMGDGPNRNGLSRRNVLYECEQSLRRLRTDWIDIYFAHRFDPTVALDEVLHAFDTLCAQGKIRYFGVSNWAAWQIAKALGASALKGVLAPRVMQPMYNLVKRQAEVELFPLAQDAGIGVSGLQPARRRGADREIRAGGDGAGAPGGKRDVPEALPRGLDVRGRAGPSGACRRGGAFARQPGRRLGGPSPGRHLPDHRCAHGRTGGTRAAGARRSA